MYNHFKKDNKIFGEFQQNQTKIRRRKWKHIYGKCLGVPYIPECFS